MVMFIAVFLMSLLAGHLATIIYLNEVHCKLKNIDKSLCCLKNKYDLK